MCVLRIMYKTRNTGTGNGMRGTRGMGGMLYSRECRQTFWEMLQNIPGNVAKMSSNIPGNVAKHSGVCHKTFRGMSPNIPGNVTKHSGKCRQTFRGTSPNIPGNVIKNSGERRQTFQRMLPIFGVKSMVAFRILSNIHDGALLRK